MNRPLIRPFKAPDGSYIMHPDFVSGLIKHLSLQNYDNERQAFDQDATHQELLLALQAFEELAVADAQSRGMSDEMAKLQALGIFDSFVAGATGVQ